MNRLKNRENRTGKIHRLKTLKNTKPLLKAVFDMSVIACLITIATLISFVLRDLKVHEANIIMTYLLSVLLVSYFIEGYISSFVAAVLGVLTFNYFFTEPYYSLATYRPDYPVTFVFMFAAATLTSTLTIKVRHEAKISSQREKRAYLLYHVSLRLLYGSKEIQIGAVIGEDVSEIMNVKTVIAYCNEDGDVTDYQGYENGKVIYRFWELSSHQKAAMSEVAKKQMNKTTEKQFYDDENMFYVPVVGQTGSLGVIGFSLHDGETLSEEKRELCVIIASLMAMAIERERLNEEKRKVAIQIESEQLRGNLLRAISHDLRTPLTGILGATGTLIENREILTDDQKSELLSNTYEETKWLIHTVENILSLTQLEEGKVKLKIKQEFMEETMAEVVSRTAKQLVDHQVELSVPKELIMVDMDGQLIEHVLINLLDNASKYTPKGSLVKLIVSYEGDMVKVQVKDNGPGIPKKAMDKLFNRFYTSGETSDHGRKGIGLGLEICKAIIEAHGGRISAYNNESVGATFEFSIPIRRNSIEL